jgi:hypothetical protein
MARRCAAAAKACRASNRIPVNAFTSSGRLARILVMARSASLAGSRSPAIIASIMARPDTDPASLEMTEVSLHRASSRVFSSRCQHRVRSWVRCSSCRVYWRSARISGGGTNDGRSRPISVSRAIHCASVLSVFGRPGRFRAWEAFTSWTSSPAASSTENHVRQ